MNTAWLRDTVRQTSLGKSGAGADLRSALRPLTSLGMSAWPYRVTTQYSYHLDRTEHVDNKNSQGLYSLSGKTSYRKISWSLEAARFGFKPFQSLWNLADTSAAALPRYLSTFRAILPLQHPISRLRDFTRFGGKTSYGLVNRGPGLLLTKNIQRFDLAS